MSFRAGGVFGDEFWTQEDIDTVWVCDHAGCIERTQFAQAVHEARSLATSLGWVITDTQAFCPKHREDHPLGTTGTGPFRPPEPDEIPLAATREHGFVALAGIVGTAYQGQVPAKDLAGLLEAHLTQEQRGEARFYHQILKQHLPEGHEPYSSMAIDWLTREGTSVVKPP